MKKAMIKVGFHILCFFMYHYGINMIWYIEAGEDVVKINYTTRHYWEAETISIILRAMTIAVYLSLSEQNTISALFLPLKVLKKKKKTSKKVTHTNGKRILQSMCIRGWNSWRPSWNSVYHLISIFADIYILLVLFFWRTVI